MRGLEKDAPVDQGTGKAGHRRWRHRVPHGRETLPLPGQELRQSPGGVGKTLQSVKSLKDHTLVIQLKGEGQELLQEAVLAAQGGLTSS